MIWNYGTSTKHRREADHSRWRTSCSYCWTKLDEKEAVRDFSMQPGGFTVEKQTVKVCPACGWWCVSLVNTSDYYTNEITHEFAAAGTLADLSSLDHLQEIDEIKKYLVAKQEAFKVVNPYKFEDVVGSVFGGSGYHAVVTNKSNDGGIDVLLEGADGVQVGIQVKRTKNKISVMQMREFVGALVVNNLTQGIYVTTSEYTSGAKGIAGSVKPEYEIKLIDGVKFYDALKLSQIEEYTPESGVPFEKPLYHLLYSDYGDR